MEDLLKQENVQLHMKNQSLRQRVKKLDEYTDLMESKIYSLSKMLRRYQKEIVNVRKEKL